MSDLGMIELSYTRVPGICGNFSPIKILQPNFSPGNWGLTVQNANSESLEKQTQTFAGRYGNSNRTARKHTIATHV